MCPSRRGKKRKRKKKNLGDVPVSHHTAEAKVMFTWVTHDKTGEEGSQEQSGASTGFAICARATSIKGSSWGGNVKPVRMVTW